MDTSMSVASPKSIPISQMMIFKNSIDQIHPIDGLSIPNVTIPPQLSRKKMLNNSNETISISIRHLFNSLTSNNISEIKEQLKNIVVTKVQSAEMIEEIAQEMLSNFLISEKNIKNYMQLLNSVHMNCILLKPQSRNDNVKSDKNVTPTIGCFFIKKCGEKIFNYISEKNIRKMAQMDQDDDNELDSFNRSREKINNLIITICHLYEQRKTTYIKLTAVHLYTLIDTILMNYRKCQNKMKDLGNPYQDEKCNDEIEYEILRKMCSLYAEQLYIFMKNEAKEFNNDQTNVNGSTLKVLVERFKSEVVPTLTEAYLISKCENIDF